MEDLPYEVLSEIFTRLLAKQVGQMRCVSKSWNALLSDSAFVKSHLHRSHNTDNILLFFLWGFSFSCCPCAASPSRSPHIKLPTSIKLLNNPQSEEAKGCVIGSVNGLMCFDDGDAVHIWNPSMSLMLTLPPSSVPTGDATVVNYFGFGYDPKTDDYKVLKLRGLYDGTNMLPEIEVYSMRKGSWVLIPQKFPSHIKQVLNDFGVRVGGHDGHLHWLCSTDLEWKEPTIMAFDLGAETFCEIPLPDSILHLLEDCGIMVGVLGGKLCVMSCTSQGGVYEVWVMEEYESWAKHQYVLPFSDDILLYGFTSHGEFLFRDDEDGDRDLLRLYDPIAAQTKSFKVPDGSGVYYIVEYVDSLVWVSPHKHEHEHEISISSFKS